MSKVYEVYVCTLGEEVLYVGQGGRGRHKHCSSGCSHVYALNKLHFEGVVVDIRVVSIFDTKEKALEFEKELILAYKPKFNSIYVNDTRNLNRAKVEDFRKAWKAEEEKFDLKYNNKSKFNKLKREFFDFYRPMTCLSGEVTIYSIDHYRNIGKHKIRALSRSLRDDTSTWSSDNYCLVFAECFEKVLGYSLKSKLHNT